MGGFTVYTEDKSRKNKPSMDYSFLYFFQLEEAKQKHDQMTEILRKELSALQRQVNNLIFFNNFD